MDVFERQEISFMRDLIELVGTEVDFRKRQRLFLIQSKLIQVNDNTLKYIAGGSLSEGIDLPGSDIDMTLVASGIEVLQNGLHEKPSNNVTTLITVYDPYHPGYTKIKFYKADDELLNVSTSLVGKPDGLYLSSELWVNFFMANLSDPNLSVHGPCVSEMKMDTDYAIGIKVRHWPTVAIPWVNRHRKSSWPPDWLIDNIVQQGSLLVPVGPKQAQDSNLLWRISFLQAERKLVHSLNYTQLLCYVLLKLTLKKIININKDVEDLLSSYILKTAVFWLAEETPIEEFGLENVSTFYYKCLDKIREWITQCFCPHYFIPANNLFHTKINPTNNKPLLDIIDRIKHGGFVHIAPYIFPKCKSSQNALSIDNSNTVKLDMLFFRIREVSVIQNLDDGYRTLHCLTQIMQTETSNFLKNVCQYYYACVCQQIVQMIPWPKNHRLHNAKNLFRHKLLQNGTKSDAVTGWVLYACFYYRVGQYKATLDITDFVLSRCKEFMTMLGVYQYSSEICEAYKKKINSRTLSFNERLKLATTDDVVFVKRSSLIPSELTLEVQDSNFLVLPDVMAGFLQVLCYYHMGNSEKTARAIYAFCMITKDYPTNYQSDILTLMGVCHELTGSHQMALMLYDLASSYKINRSKTAELRKSKLWITPTNPGIVCPT